MRSSRIRSFMSPATGTMRWAVTAATAARDPTFPRRPRRTECSSRRVRHRSRPRVKRPSARRTSPTASAIRCCSERDHTKTRTTSRSMRRAGACCSINGAGGELTTDREMIGHVTMSGYVPINFQLPFSYANRTGQNPPADTYADFQATWVNIAISLRQLPSRRRQLLLRRRQRPVPGIRDGPCLVAGPLHAGQLRINEDYANPLFKHDRPVARRPIKARNASEVIDDRASPTTTMGTWCPRLGLQIALDGHKRLVARDLGMGPRSGLSNVLTGSATCNKRFRLRRSFQIFWFCRPAHHRRIQPSCWHLLTCAIW